MSPLSFLLVKIDLIAVSFQNPVSRWVPSLHSTLYPSLMPNTNLVPLRNETRCENPILILLCSLLGFCSIIASIHLYLTFMKHYHLNSVSSVNQFPTFINLSWLFSRRCLLSLLAKIACLFYSLSNNKVVTIFQGFFFAVGDTLHDYSLSATYITLSKAQENSRVFSLASLFVSPLTSPFSIALLCHWQIIHLMKY